MRRRRLAVLPATAALLAAVPALPALAAAPAAAPLTAAPAAPAPLARGTFTATHLSFKVNVGPNGGKRTCTVDADLRVPNGLGTRQVPALLMSNGFGGSKDDTGANGNGAYAARFAELGYVTLSFSALGFAGSNDCPITIDDPTYDGQAGSALVSFLGGDPNPGGVTAPVVPVTDVTTGQPYTSRPPVVHDRVDHDGVARTYDPRVGMIGGSYGGGIQFAVAGQDHRVDALAPVYTWNELGYSLAPNNADQSSGVMTGNPGASKYQWQHLFGALGEVQLPNRPPLTVNPDCPGTRVEVCKANAEAEVPGYPLADSAQFAASVSVGEYMNSIKVPVLLSQGQNDTLFNLQEAIASYRSLSARGVPTRMIWQSWGHSGGTPVAGELDPGTLTPGSGTLDQTYEGRIYIDWFAHWLKRVPNDLGPAVRYYRDYAYTPPAAGATPAQKYVAAAAAYASATTYPVSAPQVLSLSGGKDLVSGPPTAGSQTFAQPGGNAGTSYSETSAVGPVTAPTDAPGTFASWSTGPLSAPLDVTGVPVLTVHLSDPVAAAAQAAGPGGQLVLYAKLYDVAPDGTKSLVHGLISPARIADVTRPVRLELPGIVHRYDTGHALQLVLAAGDSAYHGNVAASTVTVADDPAAPSTLALPVAPAAAAGPTPVVPEAPLTALLPLAAVAALGTAVLVRRRRRA